MNSLLKPNLVENTANHKFPKSITVKKSITMNTPTDRSKMGFTPFRANIGGRYVTLRRMKIDSSEDKKCLCSAGDPGACVPPCSTKQPTTKMCVRKAPDGTYRVTSNSSTNTNGLTIKKFKSNIQNSDNKQEATSLSRSFNIPKSIVNPSDEDNQPSTSNAAYKRKTLPSTVPPKVIRNVFAYLPRTRKEYRIPSSDSEETSLDNDKHRNKIILTTKQRNGTMIRRNTCFVPKPRVQGNLASDSIVAKNPNGITIRRNTLLMSNPQGQAKKANYLIPQSMLTSSTEHVVRKSSASSNESFSNQSALTATSPANGEDLFLIQEQKSAPMNSSGSSRRKSSLEPMQTFSGDTNFDEIFSMPPRPRQNIQLIESLARYRTIVKFMLNHLQINQIDFNNDDYINLYKFYRG